MFVVVVGRHVLCLSSDAKVHPHSQGASSDAAITARSPSPFALLSTSGCAPAAVHALLYTAADHPLLLPCMLCPPAHPPPPFMVLVLVRAGRSGVPPLRVPGVCAAHRAQGASPAPRVHAGKWLVGRGGGWGIKMRGRDGQPASLSLLLCLGGSLVLVGACTLQVLCACVAATISS